MHDDKDPDDMFDVLGGYPARRPGGPWEHRQPDGEIPYDNTEVHTT
ncbi:MAG TPA: hypothetical protein VHB02_14500 [Acidimicrobiales bacterium]|nr:hypothetical protein [Acidimicrobiales bacterium]